MKKLFFFLSALFMAGCMHYATPHGQDITLKNIDKLPVKVGLYIPASISKDSVRVDNGSEIFESHLYIMLRSGATMANAINKAVTASVYQIQTYDSYPDATIVTKDSLAFFIIPEFNKQKATLWPTMDRPSAYESELKLTCIGRDHYIIDSTIIHCIGVCSTSNNIHRKDTVVADATDSAISSMQDQIVNYITGNQKLRSYLHLPPPSHDLTIITPVSHGVFGVKSQFILDSTSYSLIPIPAVRRWAEWIVDGFDSYDLLYFGVGLDVLFQSRFSFRLGLLVSDYFERPDPLSIFSDPRFGNQDGTLHLNWAIAAQASYLFFGPRHFLEAGVGMQAAVGKISGPHLERFAPMAIIGYRYQPVLSGIGFSIGYTPYFDRNGLQDRLSLGAGLAF